MGRRQKIGPVRAAMIKAQETFDQALEEFIKSKCAAAQARAFDEAEKIALFHLPNAREDSPEQEIARQIAAKLSARSREILRGIAKMEGRS